MSRSISAHSSLRAWSAIIVAGSAAAAIFVGFAPDPDADASAAAHEPVAVAQAVTTRPGS
ncbi:MAG TPA: hypothetical protein VIO94_12060 [Phenylobacterium sp.]